MAFFEVYAIIKGMDDNHQNSFLSRYGGFFYIVGRVSSGRIFKRSVVIIKDNVKFRLKLSINEMFWFDCMGRLIFGAKGNRK